MKMLSENFGVDKSTAVVNYGEFSVTIRQAYRTNKAYMKMMERELDPVRRAFEAGKLGNDKAQQILVKIFAHTIVVDWTIKDDDGKKVPFSVEKCIEFLTEYPKLFDLIKEDAEDDKLFRSHPEEDEEKN